MTAGSQRTASRWQDAARFVACARNDLSWTRTAGLRIVMTA